MSGPPWWILAGQTSRIVGKRPRAATSSGEIGEHPSRQRKRGDRSDESEAGPAADHPHRQILALQEVAERCGPAAGLFVSLSRHAFHYATEGGRRTGKMQRMSGVGRVYFGLSRPGFSVFKACKLAGGEER